MTRGLEWSQGISHPLPGVIKIRSRSEPDLAKDGGLPLARRV